MCRKVQRCATGSALGRADAGPLALHSGNETCFLLAKTLGKLYVFASCKFGMRILGRRLPLLGDADMRSDVLENLVFGGLD